MTEGLVHFSKIQKFIQHSEFATIQGTAYRLKVGFPIVLEEGSDLIEGQVISVSSSDVLLGLLDSFHGYIYYDQGKSLYVRKSIPVRTQSGEEVAWVYFFNPSKKPTTAVYIEKGLWKENLEKEPSLIQSLTERQKAYISKLGAASGREIVPIQDLSLYRELMNLELIVDKGRRLALSKLGHEVYRYLD